MGFLWFYLDINSLFLIRNLQNEIYKIRSLKNSIQKFTVNMIYGYFVEHLTSLSFFNFWIVNLFIIPHVPIRDLFFTN